MRDILRETITPTKKKRIANKLYKMAMDGDVRAMALIYDNHDGKIPQGVEVSGPEGSPIVLKWDANADT